MKGQEQAINEDSEVAEDPNLVSVVDGEEETIGKFNSVVLFFIFCCPYSRTALTHC